MDLDVAGPVIGRFDNSYRRLPGRFYQEIAPAKVAAPRVVKVNFGLAEALGLDLGGLDGAGLADVFAGNVLPAGAAPLAQAYAGHQFGGFSPQLGDGRANLLGEVIDPAGRRWDVQLKGSGPTAFSRRGDGRAALGPVLREYIVSEAMAGLGIPATRALAAVTTGEMVARERMLPGAVLTRVAASHVRVGTFQYFAARGDAEGLRVLADYVIGRHYPEAASAENPYLALLEAVVARQAALVARWMGVGFVHGVMNTDNMAVSGETIDFGPCAFMEDYDPGTVFSSIDEVGRYAYANQPAIAQWNLARLAETLLPVMGLEEDAAVAAATAVLQRFGAIYQAAWLGELRGKLGLYEAQEGDAALAGRLVEVMKEAGADFTMTFRALADAADGDEAAALGLIGAAWLAEWRGRLAREAPEAGRGARMRRKNPVYIPRNHLVERAISAAVERGDFAPFEALVSVVEQPFEVREGLGAYALPAAAEERVLLTYCGT
jgi:uncharacterized protein YdiU (UPF0061 family)